MYKGNLLNVSTILYRIAELNRKTLDALGTQSSKMLPAFTPVYESKYISNDFKIWLNSQSQKWGYSQINFMGDIQIYEMFIFRYFEFGNVKQSENNTCETKQLYHAPGSV